MPSLPKSENPSGKGALSSDSLSESANFSDQDDVGMKAMPW